MRWIWLDGFTAFESGVRARSVKNLSLAEDHFAQHFPGYPVMPASLIIEGLAQTGGILVGEKLDFKEKVVLGKVLKARFEREFLAGETLEYDAEIVMVRSEGSTVIGKVFCDGKQEAEVEIFFAHLGPSWSKTDAAAGTGNENFVFSSELRSFINQARRLDAQAKAKTGPG
jgi:3-hydroxyacyl-[acyl-carrier-protein] dehydratase